MISIDLIEELKKELENLFKEELVDDYDTKFESKKIPKINTGWYTQKVDKEDFPYVLISPIQQTWSRDVSRVDLVLIIGTYSKDLDGWKDTALMAERIRQYLTTNKYVAKKYEINPDARVEFPDDQPYPITFCAMYVSFNVYNPYNVEGGELTW
ncbi:MAG: hypothetical protein E6987_00330 [Peptoniphilus harei]|nr:hypothetical protein [Peptoniphilus harei]